MALAIGSSPVAPVAKFAVAFPLTFHFLGAVSNRRILVVFHDT